MLTDNFFFSANRLWQNQDYFGGQNLWKYTMGLGQGSRAAPPSWIQVSTVVVNVYKQLGLGGHTTDPLSQETICTMGAVFVGITDLYSGRKDSVKSTKLWRQTQTNVNQWKILLQATEGALKPQRNVSVTQ